MPRPLIISCALAAAVAAPAATAAAAAPTPAAHPGPRCQTDHLHISLHGVPGGLDHLGTAIVFRNTGSRCTLDGYPGLDGVTAQGRTVHAKRLRAGYLGGAHHVRPVQLAGGATASALFEGTAAAPGGHAASCPRFTHVLITPPNDTRSVSRSVRFGPLCSLQIHPVVPGRTGTERP
jgi:hypothetical protein